ncbi:MAG: hypothetical protein K2W96_01900 [Gemmataceae bacterium]|nr:hypothetical protein [Gemmataceae bacterium]
MITSAVNPAVELVVTVPVHDIAGQAHGIEFLIDTGFNGDLSLPASVVATLGPPFVQQQPNRLADGTVVVVPSHRVVVMWDGAVRIVRAFASGGIALLSMGMLRDFHLRALCRPGGLIEIEAVP